MEAFDVLSANQQVAMKVIDLAITKLKPTLFLYFKNAKLEWKRVIREAAR